MAFTVYIIFVIALAGLIDPSYGQKVQIISKKTGNLVGADSLNLKLYGSTKLYAKKSIAINTWILTESGYLRSQKIYIAETTSNSKLILSHSRKCDDGTDVVLYERQPNLSKNNYFFINMTSGYIFSAFCDNHCLYVDEETMGIKSTNNCNAHKDNKFVIKNVQ
ncbi:uncharacterized protein [Diabrotica undecimpunctata]|uniref:uncharacterized protein n=1 Tax=Diabrotica undecimpunctata TaxID=50387 RepID=UPI003B63801B